MSEQPREDTERVSDVPTKTSVPDTAQIKASIGSLLAVEGAPYTDTDRRIITNALTVLGSIDAPVEDVVANASAVSEVIADFYMRQEEPPTELDRMHEHLIRQALTKLVSTLESMSSDHPERVGMLQRAREIATILKKGYNDPLPLSELDQM